MSILVFAENTDGNFKKSTLEAVAYAAEVAKNNSTTCVALAVGKLDDCVQEDK